MTSACALYYHRNKYSTVVFIYAIPALHSKNSPKNIVFMSLGEYVKIQLTGKNLDLQQVLYSQREQGDDQHRRNH